MLTNFDAVRNLTDEQLAWVFDCVFSTAINLKVKQIMDTGECTPEIVMTKGFSEYIESKQNSEDDNLEGYIRNPFSLDWLKEEAEPALVEIGKDDLMLQPVAFAIMFAAGITPENYEEFLKENVE